MQKFHISVKKVKVSVIFICFVNNKMCNFAVMKKIFILLAAMLLSAVNETKAQGNMTLTKRHEALAAMAANAAQGDTESLKRAADEGFDNGLTISEAKEALSHLYA